VNVPLRRSRGAQWAALALVASLTLLAWSVERAIRVDQVGGASLRAADLPPAAAPPVREVYALGRLMDAVAKDPFHPERRAPAVAYRLPGEMPVATHSVSARQDGNGLRLVGTAVGGDGGGVAMCQWTGGSPRLVRVGEQVLGLTLTRVRPGSAEFTTESGTTVVLRVPRTGT
jgi:hypothetical protein